MIIALNCVVCTTSFILCSYSKDKPSLNVYFRIRMTAFVPAHECDLVWFLTLLYVFHVGLYISICLFICVSTLIRTHLSCLKVMLLVTVYVGMYMYVHAYIANSAIVYM